MRGPSLGITDRPLHKALAVARHNMKPSVYITLILFSASCLALSKQLQTLDTGHFKITIPKNWTKFSIQELDSHVGGFTNGIDTLYFDFGKYSQEIDGYESSKHLYGQDTINGFIAVLQIPKIDGNGSIKLSFPLVSDDNKFSLVGKNIKGTKQVLDIFKSVTFRTSNKNINSLLTLDKFKPYDIGNGRIIYINNCASCHNRNLKLVGPALTNELLNSKTNDWLYSYFTDRKHLFQDSAYLKRKNEFAGIDCVELPTMPKQIIDQLICYLRGR